MAPKRPPGTYSPSARTGRRGGGSGSVAGMVRRAGSDALLMSLRSTVPVGSSAASIRRGNRPNTAFGFRGCFDMRNTLQHNPGPRGTRISPAGYLAAFFLRAAQEAFIRSDTASFSLAVIGRRFLVGVASDAVSATGVATAAGRCEEERRAAGFAGAEAPRILSTSFNALISACRRSISLCRSAIAFAMTLMSFPGAVSSVGRHALGSAERVPMGSDSSPTSVRRPDGARRSQLRWVGTPTMVTKSPRERVRPRRSLVRRPLQPPAGTGRPG